MSKSLSLVLWEVNAWLRMPWRRIAEISANSGRAAIQCLLFLMSLQMVSAAWAIPQPSIPSGSKRFVIVDNGDPREAELVDDLPLDTYAYHPGPGAKEIRIKTDRAQRVFRFPRGERVDFVIDHGGRRYPQRLAPVEPHQWRGPDELVLPFDLNDNHGIIVEASVNGSPPVKLLFDTGASVSVLSEEAEKKKGARLAGAVGSIRLGSVEVKGTPIISIPYGGGLKADGVLGYNVFLGRQITIDYGRRELRIGKPGAAPPGYRTIPLYWIGSRTMLDVGVSDGRVHRRVPVLLDTGSRFSLSFSNKDPLSAERGGLREVGWQYGRSGNGDEIKSRVFVMPKVTLAGFSLSDVQANVEVPGQTSQLPVHILGNDYLRRFDLIIDYRNGLLHVRPNGKVGEPYNRVSRFDRTRLFAIAATLVIGVLLAGLWWRRRKRLSLVA